MHRLEKLHRLLEGGWVLLSIASSSISIPRERALQVVVAGSLSLDQVSEVPFRAVRLAAEMRGSPYFLGTSTGLSGPFIGLALAIGFPLRSFEFMERGDR